jgi:Fe-S cluster assembly ATPase SufC
MPTIWPICFPASPVLEMTKSARKNDKLAGPDAHFAEPKDVLMDGSLSDDEKSRVLDSLELDARLLETAASEGMSGGELNKLYEVLQAKDHLAPSRKTEKV